MILLGPTQVCFAELILRRARANAQGIVEVTASQLAQAQHGNKQRKPVGPGTLKWLEMLE